MVILVYLHSATQSVMELLALIGPAAVIFGAGTLIVLLPIVRAGGERYQHDEYHAKQQGSNGNGHSHVTEAGRPAQKAPAAPIRRKG